jgi:hypothetical protein
VSLDAHQSVKFLLVLQILKEAKRDGELVCCCTNAYDPMEEERDYQGLELAHAYTLLQVGV